ncbi:MAG: DUF2971 domain-containing protein [Acidobacteriota bacterium]
MVDRIAVSLGIETMLDMAVQAVHKLTTSFRVYSMSKRSDNLSMWEWYASKHTGYCLEFARAGLFGIVREVVYDMSYVMDVTDDAHATANWFFYKSPDWSNEEEVRLVLPKHSGGPVLQIDPRLMSRVILGKDMLSTNAEQVRTWAATRVPPVPVVTARWNPLDLTLITDSEPAPGNR